MSESKTFSSSKYYFSEILQAQGKKEKNCHYGAGWEFFYGISNNTTRYILLSFFSFVVLYMRKQHLSNSILANINVFFILSHLAFVIVLTNTDDEMELLIALFET